MHDCCATGLRIEKDTLILTFEDGVWACAGSAVNPGEKTIRTGRGAAGRLHCGGNGARIFPGTALFRMEGRGASEAPYARSSGTLRQQRTLGAGIQGRLFRRVRISVPGPRLAEAAALFNGV